MSDHKHLSEDEAIEIALRDHPELREGWMNGTLPQELTDDSGNVWSPRMHISLHAIVERQIANDEPRGVADIAQQLAESGVDRHEIRHIIAQPLAEQIWQVMHEGHAFDADLYLSELEEAIRNYG